MFFARLRMRVFSGSMLYVLCSVSAGIRSLNVAPCIQSSALFCTDCILYFCEFDTATSGIAVHSRIGLTVVL